MTNKSYHSFSFVALAIAVLLAFAMPALANVASLEFIERVENQGGMYARYLVHGSGEMTVDFILPSGEVHRTESVRNGNTITVPASTKIVKLKDAQGRMLDEKEPPVDIEDPPVVATLFATPTATVTPLPTATSTDAPAATPTRITGDRYSLFLPVVNR